MTPNQKQSQTLPKGQWVADHISAMLAYWDKDQLCQFANAAYVDWFGITPEQMIGKITLQQLLGPLYEKNLPYINGALQGMPQTFEREIKTMDGKVRYSLANYFPDWDNGVVVGFFVHVADITPIKLMEQEIQQKNATINEQNTQLLNFANIVSHNLTTYAHNLDSILGYFINAKTENEKSELLTYLTSIAKGFSGTVNNLNEIVLAQNQRNFPLKAINLHSDIEKVLATLVFQIQSNNAVVINNVSTKITFLANSAYIESILLNFLTNALKYKHPDRNPVIVLEATSTEKEVILSIADNGRGINLAKHKNSLFGMYKTFHGNADAKGIGLYIAKFQVEAMGGCIEVESEEGKGTTFKVHFKA